MTVSRALILVAVIIFVLVGLGVTLGSVAPLELAAFGLAFFTAGHF
jgi:hypothetical protein